MWETLLFLYILARAKQADYQTHITNLTKYK
jgi:hypothetical protein